MGKGKGGSKKFYKIWKLYKPKLHCRVQHSSAHSPSDSPENPSPPASSWSEASLRDVEAALRAYLQNGGDVQELLSHLRKRLPGELPEPEQAEQAVLKRVGAIVLQCANALDAMERELKQDDWPGGGGDGRHDLALQLRKLRHMAYEHLASALRQEEKRESVGFPVVFLN